MAEQIRTKYELLALRIELQRSRSGTRVLFEAYRGSKPLWKKGSHNYPAEVFGLTGTLGPRHPGEGFRNVPSTLTQDLRELCDKRKAEEPLWLHLHERTNHLAAVPWEQYLLPSERITILRIPNFLVDPIFLKGRLRYAICASSPAAKETFHDLAGYIRNLTQQAGEAVTQGTEAHVFTDQRTYRELQGLGTSVEKHTVHVYDPLEAHKLGIGVVDRGLTRDRARVTSPWLDWMRHTLGGDRRLDEVHFVSPGYLAQDRGALALARSPLENVDRNWSHFVGANELAYFLNWTGAWSVAFSAPRNSRWTIGLRLLAEEVAHLRPGPVLLVDTGLVKIHEVGRAYAFLYGADMNVHPPVSKGMSLYAHPKRLQHFANVEQAMLPLVIESLAAGPRLSERFGGLSEIFRKQSRREALSEDREVEPLWKTSVRLQLDEAAMRFGSGDLNAPPQQATQRGSLEGLRFVSDLLKHSSEKGGSSNRLRIDSDFLKGSRGGEGSSE